MKILKIPFSLVGFLPVLYYFHIDQCQCATELAKINGTIITLEEFNKKYKENLKFYQSQIPTRKNVLEDLIKRELGIQEAKKMGLDRDADVIERMNTVLYHALLEKKLNPTFEKIFVEDADAKSFYDKYPEIRSSQIFIGVSPNSSETIRNTAYEKIKKLEETHLKSGKMSFAEIAQQFSEGNAAPQGGDIDYHMKDSPDPTYYEAALRLKTPGKVSGIIKTSYGFHIIKLTGVRSWDEVDRPKVKRVLIEKKRRDMFEAYLKELKQKANVTVRSELVKD